MSKEKLFGALYGLIGIGIIGLWIMLLSTNQVPELETTPAAITFHIVIEVSMGILSIVTAVLLYKSSLLSKPFLLLTNGMLMYSVVNSSGYYAEQQNYVMIGMFFVLLLFTVYTSYRTIRNEELL